uniref:Uncharacterized protein n=1 Tax=Arundo donax TaxID=35708 RepID=A0A0A9FRT4_ARUDO
MSPTLSHIHGFVPCQYVTNNLLLLPVL